MGSSRIRTVYRSCEPVVDTWFDSGRTASIAEALAEALARAEGVPVTDIPPLFETIDVDALDHLFERGEQLAAAETILSFRYGKWNVFVHADGRIRVCDGTRLTALTPVFDDE